MFAIQYMDEEKSWRKALEIYAGLQQQDGYLGGRILAPSAEKPHWRIQAFFKDETNGNPNGWLPDGCRRVIVTKVIAAECGFPVDCPRCFGDDTEEQE